MRQVSVVIPTKNNAAFLEEAADSVLAQEGSFTLAELIIVDDGSTDPSARSVLQALSGQPGIRVMSNSRTPGPAGARNTGALAAASEWIAFLDADDVWLPGSLATRFAALHRFPDATLIAADFQVWYPDTAKVEAQFFETHPRPALVLAEAFRSKQPTKLHRPYREAFHTTFMHSCSLLVKRDAFWAVGGYEESLRFKEDEHLWIKLSQRNDLVFVPHSTFLYRQHSASMTAEETPHQVYDLLLLDVIARDDLLPDLKAEIRKRYTQAHAGIARWHRSRARFVRAMIAAIQGLRGEPTSIELWRQLSAALLLRA